MFSSGSAPALDLHTGVAVVEGIVQAGHIQHIIKDLESMANSFNAQVGLGRLSNAEALCKSAVETVRFQVNQQKPMYIEGNSEVWCLHVVCETTLCSLMRLGMREAQGASLPHLFLGASVELSGLVNKQLNGRRGIIKGPKNEDSGRWLVKVLVADPTTQSLTTTAFHVKETNLRATTVLFHDKIGDIEKHPVFEPCLNSAPNEGFTSHLIFFAEPGKLQGGNLPRAHRIVLYGPLENGTPQVTFTSPFKLPHLPLTKSVVPFLVIAEEEFCKKRVYRFRTRTAAMEASKKWHSNSVVFQHDNGVVPSTRLGLIESHCNQVFGGFAKEGIEKYATELTAMCGNNDVPTIASVEFNKISFRGNMRSRLVSHDGKKMFARFMTHDGHTVYDGADNDGKNTGKFEPLREDPDEHAMNVAEADNGAMTLGTNTFVGVAGFNMVIMSLNAGTGILTYYFGASMAALLLVVPAGIPTLLASLAIGGTVGLGRKIYWDATKE